MQRAIFLELFLIIIFSLSLSCYAFEGSFPPQQKPLAWGSHLKDARKEVGIESFQRRGGKGPINGGEDVLRPRGKGHRNGAAGSVMLKSSSFLSRVLLLIRYVLVFVFVVLV
ncbi:hypothetical protein P3X46_031743 [Hevea brasiliensis]|uniref:Transmembrane protein n=1 Tax=Hevea brasiliensis TaxID=3981 RepID=A0ABQ9KLB2_HEVBR|nr:hypothetical protein P3X46_031743 [Hevea brasiliensis]